MLFVLGFYSIEVVDEREEERRETGVVVSNHLSFLDVLVHCAMLDTPSFVAKESAIEVPLFGRFFSFMSCLLVPTRAHERAHSSRTGKQRTVTTAMIERQQRFDRLYEEHATSTVFPLPPLIVFSEGTTTNGVFMRTKHPAWFCPSQSSTC